MCMYFCWRYWLEAYKKNGLKISLIWIKLSNKIISVNLSQINLYNMCEFKSLCLNSYVRLIHIVVIGMLKHILISPPLYNAKNPYFLYIVCNPWKAFRYPKTDFYNVPPCVATSALWICIRSLTTSSGVVIYPAHALAVAEQIILSTKVGLSLFLTTISFIF